MRGEVERLPTLPQAHWGEGGMGEGLGNAQHASLLQHATPHTFDNHALVRHGWHVRAASGTGAHHHGHLQKERRAMLSE